MSPRRLDEVKSALAAGNFAGESATGKGYLSSYKLYDVQQIAYKVSGDAVVACPYLWCVNLSQISGVAGGICNWAIELSNNCFSCWSFASKF